MRPAWQSLAAAVLLAMTMAGTAWPGEPKTESSPAAEPQTRGAPAGHQGQAKGAEAEPSAEAGAAPSQQGRRDPLSLLDKDEKRLWYQRLQGLAFGRMVRGTIREYQEAEKDLLGITDPDALEPMALVLYTRNTRWRSSFLKSVEQFTRNPDDFASKLAVTYLSDIALGDDSAVLRGKARAALLAPETPRHPERLRYRLVSSPSATVRCRAAELLADLKDAAVLDAMVDLLVTEEWRLRGVEVESRTVQMDVRVTNAGVPTFTPATVTAAVPMGLATATIMLPSVQVTSINTTVFAPAGVKMTPDWELVTVRHPGMLLALRRLTGKDFGYDQEAWRQWLRSQPGHTGSSPYDVDWSSSEKK